MDWTAIGNFFKTNWSTFMSAPLAFVICIGMGVLVGYFAAKWHSGVKIANLEGKIDIMEQRILYKEERLDEYRQRLNLIPPEQTGTVYSRMTYAELQKEAFSLVEGIRQLISNHKEIEDKLRAESSQKEREAKANEERQQIRREYQEKEHQWFLKSMAKYDSEYKVRAMLIHEEMLSRLPKNIKSERIRFMYENPTNILGVRTIADDLEILAMNLELR